MDIRPGRSGFDPLGVNPSFGESNFQPDLNMPLNPRLSLNQNNSADQDINEAPVSSAVDNPPQSPPPSFSDQPSPEAPIANRDAGMSPESPVAVAGSADLSEANSSPAIDPNQPMPSEPRVSSAPSGQSEAPSSQPSDLDHETTNKQTSTDQPAAESSKPKIAASESDQVRVDPQYGAASKTAITILIIVIASSLFLFGLNFVIKANLSKAQEQGESIDTDLSAFAQVESEAATVNEAVNNLNSITSDSLYWSKFFEKLNAQTVKYAKYNSFAFGKGGSTEGQTVQIDGEAPDYEKAGRAVYALQQAKIFSEVKMDSVVLSESAGQESVKFSISAILAPGALLKVQPAATITATPTSP